jgi:RsiW-degrading membrane proteinase PrsW (M82 family)
MTWVYNLHQADPDNKIGRVIAICVVFPTLALLAVCLRFYVRLTTKRSPWGDDYTVLASVLLTAVYGGLTIAREFCALLRSGSSKPTDFERNEMGNGVKPDILP